MQVDLACPLGIRNCYTEKAEKCSCWSRQRHLEPGEHPAEFVANVRQILHLFVYTDIIENHIVADSKVPLIRTVNVSGNYGEAVMLNFENPHYIPFKQKFIDRIQTSIKDNTGKKIRFTCGRVILKLHFRQRQSAFFCYWKILYK